MGGRTIASALLAVAATTAGAGCESTQDTSRRLSRDAENVRNVSGVRITDRNRAVRVLSRTVLHDENGVAAVVGLLNAGGAQQRVPVLIAVRDARGRTIYSNTVPGLDPSLTSMPVIARGERTFWVNNQVQAGAAPRSVTAEVGAAKPAPGSLPRIAIGRPSYGSDVSGVFLRAQIRNLSKVTQKRLVVSCVSRRGSRVVAAGRAIVDKLVPAPTRKPVTFRVYFIGDPKRGTASCIAPPTVLSGGS